MGRIAAFFGLENVPKKGTVVDHRYIPAHTTPNLMVPPHACVPAQYKHPAWAIQVEDARGRSKWVYFSWNVFATYPKGSIYSEE